MTSFILPNLEFRIWNTHYLIILILIHMTLSFDSLALQQRVQEVLKWLPKQQIRHTEDTERLWRNFLSLQITFFSLYPTHSFIVEDFQRGMVPQRSRSLCRIFWSKRFFRCSLGSFFIITFLTVTGHLKPKVYVRDVAYITRPIWDSPNEQPSLIIPHFHAEGLPPEVLCGLHGWSSRNESTLQHKVRVIDAVIFSMELELLEIRLRELWDVVDVFVVLEADRTFTGRKKRLHLEENLDSFKWASEKLVHVVLKETLEAKPKAEFSNEILTRRFMKKMIEERTDIKHGDLLIVSDVDEIPYSHTIRLLKRCVGWPRTLHLQMKTFMYSFEFPMSTDHWRPSITHYTNKLEYRHGKTSDFILSDSGWHCSFCFKNLDQFVFKMTSYSHSDRVTDPRLLQRTEIQRKICEGSDVFDMFREAYTTKDLLLSWGNLPRATSFIGMPKWVLQNSRKFRFLLPGGCVRGNVSVPLPSAIL